MITLPIYIYLSFKIERDLFHENSVDLEEIVAHRNVAYLSKIHSSALDYFPLNETQYFSFNIICCFDKCFSNNDIGLHNVFKLRF